MAKIKISVLMGIYNCASTLTEALDSLLNQTFQDFKVIMCDDGSTDSTFEVAQGYVEKYPDKFVLIQNECNKGLNHTLNKCLQLADTEYIARMDGDDISLPTRFEKEIDFLEKNKEYAVVSTPMQYFDEDGIFRIGKSNPTPQKKYLARGTPICHAPCMARTAIIKKVGGYSESPNLLRVEDYHLWIKLYAAGYKAFNLSEPLYMMRDDRKAKARRKWSGRSNEMRVRRFAITALGLPFFENFFVLRPLFAYVAPAFIYNWIHKR